MFKVLFCTDFSDNASTAFDYAIDAAGRRDGAELHLLHVLQEPDAQFWQQYVYAGDEQPEKSAQRSFDEMVASEYTPRVPANIKFQPVLRFGKSYVEIIKYADQIGANLIVMGRQGRGALHSLFFGTVAEKVVKRASCAVLVIPMIGKTE